MSGNNFLKKINKKLKKSQHTLTKETGVKCSDDPSKFLAICNSGLVNGLSEEIIIKYFMGFGNLDDIVLLPGKSCCFLSYQTVDSAIKAYETHNGKLCIAQDNKPIYLSYTESLPEMEEEKYFNRHPPGLILLENFITETEETNLLKFCNFASNNDGQMKHRNVKHYGYEFLYSINNVDKNNPMEESIPKECDFIWELLKNHMDFKPDQLTVNHYLPGQGIPSHVDTHSAFEDPIISLSLQSPIVMEFKNSTQHYNVLLPARSLAVMSGECRYDWMHGITPRKFDVIRTENGYSAFERQTRVSFTFRKVLQSNNCTCNFKRLCDSVESTQKIEEVTAIQLEKLHVHEVYESISTHFSDTRHKPWPNVLEFVQSFEVGDVLVDVGCGNGKYLGHNKRIFEVGCDRSFGLLDVCQSRGFQTFTADCLQLPLRDCIADGIISIAVIHHLATEERRLAAINEIIRVLKYGGKALIYVWAKDQHKNKQKSTYIKQDRKNRKSDTVNSKTENVTTTSVNGVVLPVHTNRTQFQHPDLLVPWKLKPSCGQSDVDTFLRFYHVFEETELEDLCRKSGGVEIVNSYYDQGNWCVVIQKNK